MRWLASEALSNGMLCQREMWVLRLIRINVVVIGLQNGRRMNTVNES